MQGLLLTAAVSVRREQKRYYQTDTAVQRGAVCEVEDACRDKQDGSQHKAHGGKLECQFAYALDQLHNQHDQRKKNFQNEFHCQPCPF